MTDLGTPDKDGNVKAIHDKKIANHLPRLSDLGTKSSGRNPMPLSLFIEHIGSWWSHASKGLKFNNGVSIASAQSNAVSVAHLSRLHTVRNCATKFSARTERRKRVRTGRYGTSAQDPESNLRANKGKRREPVARQNTNVLRCPFHVEEGGCRATVQNNLPVAVLYLCFNSSL